MTSRGLEKARGSRESCHAEGLHVHLACAGETGLLVVYLWTNGRYTVARTAPRLRVSIPFFAIIWASEVDLQARDSSFHVLQIDGDVMTSDRPIDFVMSRKQTVLLRNMRLLQRTRSAQPRSAAYPETAS